MRLLFVFILTFLSTSVFSQDRVYLLEGDVIDVKVTEIGAKELVYKKYTNPTGPDYKVKLQEIERVVYENGEIDVFNEAKSQNDSPFKVLPSELGNNIIYLNVVDILFQNITVGYERILGENRKLGIRIPVSFSLYGNNNNDILFNTYNVFYSGIDLNFYPFGQRQASFFIGPVLRSGVARFRNDIFDEFDNFSTIVSSTSYATFLFNGGFTWNPIEELTMTSSLGVGSRRYFGNSPNGRSTVTTASFWFAFGYRF